MRSTPGNPLLAEPLYLTKYIERMSTGTGDMIERCRNAGLAKPEFALNDSGLRFIPTDESSFACPSCGTKVKAVIL